MKDTTKTEINQLHPGKCPAIHPAVVHFPIVLFPVSAIFLIIWFYLGNMFFLNASYWTFMFAAIGAAIAGGTGFFDYYNASGPEHPQEGAGRITKIHIRAGVGVVVIAIVSAIWFLIDKPTNNANLVKWFAIIVFFESFLVFVQGFTGGLLVYKYHFGIEPRRPPST